MTALHAPNDCVRFVSVKMALSCVNAVYSDSDRAYLL